MRRWSGRGQFEPVVALVAVLAVSAGLVTYADTLAGVLPGQRERATAETTLDRVEDELRVAGVVRPGRLDRATAVAPRGWQTNVSLRTAERSWQQGPVPPEDAPSAQRRVSVRVGPGALRPGRLTVVIWR